MTYRRLGAKLVVGMPFKDLATADTIFMSELPAASDAAGRRALKRLQVATPSPCCHSSYSINLPQTSDIPFLESRALSSGCFGAEQHS